MKNYLLAGILTLFMALLLACGEASEPEATEAPATVAPTAVPATATPEAMEEPTEVMEEEPTAMAEEEAMSEGDAALKAAADALAGGPGAYYVGDLNQLVGPVPTYIEDDIGDNDGIPYEGLEDYLYVFDSDYYRVLVERANFDNPTQLTTTGLELSYQLACINRALTHCKLAEWWSDEVFERTDGQLKIEVVGYPELGISGEDVLELTENGTLSFAELPSAYTAGDLPAMDMKYLWGIYKDNQTFYEATAAAIPDLDKLIEDRTGGGVTVFQMWRVPENEIFFFSKEPIETLEDFHGLKVRSFGASS